MTKINFKLLICCLLCSFGLQAQNPSHLVIYGTVYGQNDIPVTGHTIVASQNGNVLAIDTTNAQGQYELFIENGSIIGPNQVYNIVVENCDSTEITQTVSNQQGTVDTAVINFYTCLATSFCHASFTYSSNPTNGNTLFTNTSNLSNNQGEVSYQWVVIANNIDTVTTENSINFDLNTPGQYYVCLNLATAVGCESSFCQGVSIGSIEDTTNNCQAAFSFLSVGENTYQFFAETNLNVPTEYLWVFDDSTTSNLANPTYTYASNSTVISACLTIYSQNCEDTYCESITPTPYTGNYFISGTLFGNPNTITWAIVHLYVLDSTSSAMTLVDSVYINSGDNSYIFNNLSSGTYYVLAMPSQQNLYAPTYYGNTLTWQDATSVVLNNISVVGKDIIFINLENPGGNGGVGGSVEQGSGKINADGEFFSNIHVVVTKPNGTAVSWNSLNTEGDFFIGNLAYGTYHIWAEKPGYNSIKTEFEISAQYPIATMTIQVSASGFLSMNSVEKVSELHLFPNPAQEQVQLSFETTENGQYQIQLINTLGQLVINQPINAGIGMQSVTINQLPNSAGLYQLSIIKNGQKLASRKLIISK